MNDKNTKQRIACYCRVSTDNKDQANSFENQQSYFLREVEKNPNFELVKIYADRGISGTQLSRPEYDQLLYDCGLDRMRISNKSNDERNEYTLYTYIRSSTRESLYDRILVKNTSRFARNTNVSQIVDELFKNHVYIDFLDLSKTTEHTDDMMLIRLFNVFDEEFSRDLSRKVYFGIKEGATKGNIHVNGRIYGYKYIQHENRLEIIPNEAEVVQLIFDLYSQGLGFRKICNYLTEHNIYTRKGKPFTNNTIKGVIGNEKYMGKSAILKYDTGIVFAKHPPRINESYELIDTDKIPPIITEELFYKCKELRNTKSDGKRGIYRPHGKYAELLVCAKCGAPYYRDRETKSSTQYYYYRCKDKKFKGVKHCQSDNIKEETLDNLIQEYYDTKQYLANVEQSKQLAIRKSIMAIKLLSDRLFNKDTEAINQVLYNIEETQSKIDNLVSLLAMGGAVADTATKQLIQLNSTMESLQQQKTELTRDDKEQLQELDNIISNCDSLSNTSIIQYDTLEQMVADIDRIAIISRSQIHITMRITTSIDKLTEQITDNLTATEYNQLTKQLIDVDYEALKKCIIEYKNRILQ